MPTNVHACTWSDKNAFPYLGVFWLLQTLHLHCDLTRRLVERDREIRGQRPTLCTAANLHAPCQTLAASGHIRLYMTNANSHLISMALTLTVVVVVVMMQVPRRRTL
jgi:hypothetical protein